MRRLRPAFHSLRSILGGRVGLESGLVKAVTFQVRGLSLTDLSRYNEWMEITINRHNTPSYRKVQFDALIQDAFGFSFSPWIESGWWMEDYISYSILEGDLMLANVSAFKMEMLVQGKPVAWIQLGAVCTRREYRGQGLSKKLMDFVLAQYPDSPIFLFANESVLNFYPRFGFIPCIDRQPYIGLSLKSTQDGMRKLALNDPAVRGYLAHRASFSGVLDCKNALPINWFHLLYSHGDHLYEIPALQTMLVAKQAGEILYLWDIIVAKPLSFDEISPFLSFPGTHLIKFGFNPDWLGLKVEFASPEEDSHLFFKGDPGLQEEFTIPMLART